MARPAIVVGVGSLHPSGPLRTAAEIAAAIGCELIVVHVLRFPTVLAPEAMSVVGAAIAAEEDDERVVHRACTGVLGDDGSQPQRTGADRKCVHQGAVYGQWSKTLRGPASLAKP